MRVKRGDRLRCRVISGETVEAYLIGLLWRCDRTSPFSTWARSTPKWQQLHRDIFFTISRLTKLGPPMNPDRGHRETSVAVVAPLGGCSEADSTSFDRENCVNVRWTLHALHNS
jgi:hypothetical protein